MQNLFDGSDPGYTAWLDAREAAEVESARAGDKKKKKKKKEKSDGKADG